MQSSPAPSARVLAQGPCTLDLLADQEAFLVEQAAAPLGDGKARSSVYLSANAGASRTAVYDNARVLIRRGVVERVASGRYRLTDKGTRALADKLAEK